MNGQACTHPDVLRLAAGLPYGICCICGARVQHLGPEWLEMPHVQSYRTNHFTLMFGGQRQHHLDALENS